MSGVWINAFFNYTILNIDSSLNHWPLQSAILPDHFWVDIVTRLQIVKFIWTFWIIKAHCPSWEKLLIHRIKVFSHRIHGTISKESIAKQSYSCHLNYINCCTFPSRIVISELVPLDVQTCLLNSKQLAVSFRRDGHVCCVVKYWWRILYEEIWIIRSSCIAYVLLVF